MTTFTWKYGKEPFLFQEMFDERQHRDSILENSRELDIEEDIKEDDFKSAYELKQPSEYLFDIHLLKLMKNAISANEYSIANKDICLYYEVVQNFLAYNKGLLISIDKSMHTETIDGTLHKDIFRFIDICRNTWQGDKSFDVIRREFPEFFDKDSLYQDEVIAIENYFQDGEHLRQPYYLYEKLVWKSSPLMKERRQLVRMIKYILPYTHVLRADNNSKVLTCQMILDDNYYYEFVRSAGELITSDTTETINSYLASTSIDEADFRNSVVHMIECINSCDRGGNHNFGRFRGKKKGCFCVFDSNIGEYISLSGPFDSNDSTIEQYFAYDQNKKQSNIELMDRINNIILADSILQNSIYARLNLLTKRYPYANNTNIPVNGETVDDAIKRKIDKNEIQSDYSCCERKIFSSLKNVNSLKECYIFVRHEPCQKCIPAIKSLLFLKQKIKMRIFYYENDLIKEFDVKNI